MTFDSVTGWEILPEGAFATPSSGAVWDEFKWNERNWNQASSGEVWVALDCETVSMSIRFGASQTNGVLTRYESATCELTLYDPGRLFDPFSDAGYAQLGALRIRAGIRVTARHVSAPATVYPLFTGFIESLEYSWNDNAARIVAADAASYFTKYDPAALDTPVGAGETAAQRMTRILDQASWPVSLRDIQSGGYAMQATTLEDSAWNEALKVSEADLGLLTVAPNGVVTYIPQSRLPWSGTVDASVGSGTGIAITEAIGTEDDSSIINDISAAKAGSTVIYRQADATSAALYGYAGNPVYYALSRTDLPLANDIDAQAWARTVIAVHAYPEARVSPLTVRLAENGVLISNPVQWKAIAGLRIGKRWRVICTPIGIDEDFHVRGWTFDIFRDARSLEWNATVATTSAVWSTGLIWDDARYGRWDEFSWS